METYNLSESDAYRRMQKEAMNKRTSLKVIANFVLESMSKDS